MYVNIGQGKKASMPRYYKEKMYWDAERRFINRKNEEKVIEKEKDMVPLCVNIEWIEHQKLSKQLLKNYADKGRNKI